MVIFKVNLTFILTSDHKSVFTFSTKQACLDFSIVVYRISISLPSQEIHINLFTLRQQSLAVTCKTIH